jgi:hypothetical protein
MPPFIIFIEYFVKPLCQTQKNISSQRINIMGGGLLQLVAYGAQDAYITGNPHITFWKVLYKRHTNFAMEAFRVNFTGAPQYGQRVVAVINRNADLMYKTYLEVVLTRHSINCYRCFIQCPCGHKEVNVV